jgi:hypothetical protein
MGAVGKVPAAIAMAAALVALASPARAQDGAAAVDEGARGFGERGSVLLSVENVFGVLDQTYSQGSGNTGTSTTLDDNGFFPQGFVGTKLGINGLLSSGITLGGIVGVWNQTSTNQNGGSFTVFNIGPRIGWAGCLKKHKALGFWGRVGPTFQYVNASNGGNNGGSEDWALALSFEAFFVWSPVDHFGLLAGPTVDAGLTGHASQNNPGGQSQGSDFGYHAVGMSLGLVFEL